jgi:aryl-alcohol dehydrogenase-like predicted oxidoreductase
MNKKNIPNKFFRYKNFFENWENICKKKKMTKYEVCLKYALSNSYIDKVIVGIDSSRQFKKLINSAGYIDVSTKSIDASKEINLINPSKW